MQDSPALQHEVPQTLAEAQHAPPRQVSLLLQQSVVPQNLSLEQHWPWFGPEGMQVEYSLQQL